MKIQCDVCEKQRASVFCAADEAALCEECDQRVHHANKLASKHQRLSLQHPSFKDAPLCDICQDRKALLFCREDRAILCRECDIPIHKANEHTQNHSRFLLTGVKLTTPSSTHCPNSSPLSSTSSNPSSKNKRSASVSSHNFDHDVFSQRNLRNNSNHLMGTNTPTTATTTTTMMMNYRQNSQEGSNSTSNTISEYLTDTIPGWRLEDLLGSSPSYDHYI